MTLNNLISIDFSEDEIKQIEDSLTLIESRLKNKLTNLTPQDKQKIHNPGTSIRVWINKISELIKEHPELVPTYMDADSFKKDIESLTVLQSFLIKVKALHEGMEDTAHLLNAEIYKTAISFYRYIKLISREDIPGATNMYKDLAAQFKYRRNS